MMFAFSLETQDHDYDFQLLLIIRSWRVFAFYVRYHTMFLLTEGKASSTKVFRFRRSCKSHSFLIHPFSTPKNIRKSYDFLIFSGGIERVDWGKWVNRIAPEHFHQLCQRFLWAPFGSSSSTLSTLCMENNKNKILCLFGFI